MGPKGSCINLSCKREGVTHIISGMKEIIIYVHGTRYQRCDLYSTLCDEKKKSIFFGSFKTSWIIDAVLKKMFLN